MARVVFTRLCRTRAPLPLCTCLRPLSSSTSVNDSVARAYTGRITSNSLRESEGQLNVVRDLDKLLLRLTRFAHARHAVSNGGPNATTSATSTLSTEADVLEPFPDVRAVGAVPKGLYIWGPVGTGKTMLMDLLYSTLDSDGASSEGARADAAPLRRIPMRRVHFHAFMLEVHRRIHEWKKASLQRDGRSMHVDTRPERDAIVHVARAIAAESWLLCFDEFQVTDIADALILSRMFKVLWSNGVVVVATSNRPPASLYENGLNRHYFLPFTDMLAAHTKVVHLDTGTDYRSEGAEAAPGAFLAPAGPATDTALLVELFKLCPGHGLRHVEDLSSLPFTSLPVLMGRTLPMRMLGKGVAVASFVELCARPVAAADYLALTASCSTLVLTDIPVLRPHKHNEARRFITLIDALYEAGTDVVFTAAAPLQDIFRPLLGLKAGAAGSGVRGHPEDSHVESAGTAYNDPAQGSEVQLEVEEDEAELLSGDAQGSGGAVDTAPQAQPNYRPGAASVVSSAAEVAALGELTFACRRALSRLVQMTSTTKGKKGKQERLQ